MVRRGRARQHRKPPAAGGSGLPADDRRGCRRLHLFRPTSLRLGGLSLAALRPAGANPGWTAAEAGVGELALVDATGAQLRRDRRGEPAGCLVVGAGGFEPLLSRRRVDGKMLLEQSRAMTVD